MSARIPARVMPMMADAELAGASLVSGSHCLGGFGGGRVGQEDRHAVDRVDHDHGK